MDRQRSPAQPASPVELQLWMSPAFPVGSFAYSHGLEWAAGTGRVRDRASAEAWLGDLLRHGAARNDAILLGVAWRAAEALDGAALAEVNALALALAGARERWLETVQQGNAFLATVKAAWNSGELEQALRVLDGDTAYPVAVGAAAGARGFQQVPTLEAFLTSVMQNLVSALVRLAVIGQTDGQRVLAALVPALAELAGRCPQLGLDDIGSAAFLSDIAAMAHETQDTRLFRS
jgi:urease accessory protein